MASLNLLPNPPVLLVQAGIFLVSFVVIKKLFVAPYLMVRDRREKLTLGSKDAAVQALARTEVIGTEIAAKLSAAAAVAKKDREALRETAVVQRKQIMGVAEGEARAYVESIERQIKAELAQERGKLPEIIRTLTNEVYQVALN